MLLLLLYADTHRTAQRSPQKAEGIHTDLRENEVVHHREGETPCRPCHRGKAGCSIEIFYIGTVSGVAG